MIKLKLIFSLFFFLAIQLAGFSSNIIEQSSLDQKTNEIKTSFEENNSRPGIFGEVPSGRVSINYYPVRTDCFQGNTKSKYVLSGLVSSVTKSKLQFYITRTSAYTRYSAVYIPIYLQTGSFLI